MKVKNIAFSGFAAVILAGVCGVADAASINLASKSYVDTALQGKVSVDDFESLESTVGQKATQEALKEVLDQVIINTNDIADLKAGGYITDDDLAEVQRTLQAAIDEKQAKGEYAAASELESLKTTVETLQKGEVSKETVDNLQASVDAIVADYAKKSELTSAEERLQAAINAIKIPDLSVYAKTADLAAVATSGSYNDLTDKPTLITQDDLTALRTALETEIAKKQNSGDYATAEALQTISTELGTLKGDVYTKAEVEARIAEAATGGEIDLDGYATVAALNNAVASLQDKDTELSNGLSALTASLAGYVKSGSLAAVATSGLYSDLQGKPEIPSIAGLATEQALNDLQTALEAEIAKKQAAGEYLVANDLTELNNAVATLQTGKADKSTVESIQATISKLGDTYATDTELTNAIAAIDIPSLEGYVKSSDLAAVATTGLYSDLQGKPEIPSIAGLATEQALNDLQTALEAEIAKKQAAGEYLVANDLTELNNAVAALQSDKADASTVESIQTTISKLGETYATKSELTSTEERLQAAIDAIDIPSLAGYAKTADVDAALALKADKSEVKDLVTSTQLDELRTALEAEIAKKQNSGDYATAEALQTISTELGTLKGDVYTKAEVEAKIAEAATGGEVDLSGYATTSALNTLTELVNGNTTEINALKNAGYQTSTQVSEAISTATATLATKDELNTKQDTLTAGTNIEIVDNTISASVDTSSFMANPTNPGIGSYLLYASCTNKKCNYSLKAVDEVVGSGSGGSDYGDF